ncbi:MAG: acyl-CoA thioesterase/bile acid-CoA:amino acid N-acyltransferase family protein [Pseudomonadota bacterium]
MKLDLNCPDGALFEPVGIELTGLQPHEAVTIELSFQDDAKVDWVSRAAFAADAEGGLSTDRNPALSGSYTGVDPCGLFWSARPDARPELPQRILNGDSVTLMPAIAPLAPYEWTVFVRTETKKVAHAKLIRRRLMPNVRQSDPPAPLQGMVFEPEAPNGASVLVVGGSEGGVFPARAALLAAAGFRTYALAYFQHPGCPEIGRDLPLEYFRDALQWLKQSGDGSVGVIGVSRGSEAAQLTALQWPDLVDALVLWVPSHVVNRGLDLAGGADFRRENSAMWSLAGKPVPGVGFLSEDIAATSKRDFDFATLSGRRYADEFKRAWLDQGAQFRIPIENFEGPLLAVAGQEDALWPSALGAEQICAVIKPQTGPRDFICYDNAGHLIGTPNEPRPFPWLMHWSGGYMGVENGFCAYGGTREGAALAARDSWMRQVHFLVSHLT